MNTAADLTGLPPSAEEVNAFIKDSSDDAYDNLVQRLLDSPHFGERMALDWLDTSRYADTNGYSIDGGRKMWLWRDWVNNAVQLEHALQPVFDGAAGRRSDAESIRCPTATGFQRNNMVTNEGGTIPEENLTRYNVDRVQTLGRRCSDLPWVAPNATIISSTRFLNEIFTASTHISIP